MITYVNDTGMSPYPAKCPNCNGRPGPGCVNIGCPFPFDDPRLSDARPSDTLVLADELEQAVDNVSAGSGISSLMCRARDVAARLRTIRADPSQNELWTAPGAADLTFGSVLYTLIAYAFQRVETLDPQRTHRFYTECRHCRGSDQKRQTGERSRIDLVNHEP